MPVQKIVERFSRKGAVGQKYDSSLQRKRAFKVYGGTTAVAASIKVVLSANPTAGDTITIGDVEYKFVTALSSPAALNEVVIGAAASNTATNLKDAVLGGSGGSTFSADQPANPVATASASSATVTVTAKATGAKGNEIAIATSNATAIVFGTNHLYGGADADKTAFVGRGFSYDSADAEKVNMGLPSGASGDAAFAGIFTGPLQLANFNNFEDNLGIRNGSQGEIMRFGTCWVRVTTDVNPTMNVFINVSDGSFAGSASSSLSGHVALGKARFLGVAKKDDIVGIELSY